MHLLSQVHLLHIHNLSVNILQKLYQATQQPPVTISSQEALRTVTIVKAVTQLLSWKSSKKALLHKPKIWKKTEVSDAMHIRCSFRSWRSEAELLYIHLDLFNNTTEASKSESLTRWNRPSFAFLSELAEIPIIKYRYIMTHHLVIRKRIKFVLYYFSLIFRKLLADLKQTCMNISVEIKTIYLLFW